MSKAVVLANLDVDVVWARHAGHVVRDLSRDVLGRISSYGTLLRVLWPEADTLWTPVPVAARTVCAVAGVRDVSLRAGAPVPRAARRSWARPDAWAVNHRQFAHRLAHELDIALPGSLVVESWSQCREATATCARWVLKAPYSSAGRHFMHGRHDAFDTAQGAAQARRLLAAQGALLLQPWRDRAFDVGVCVREGRTTLHELRTDARGRFRGVTVGPPPGLSPAHRQSLIDLAPRIGRALMAAGYDGPFGFDAFVEAGGALVPMCEVNARHTFGHVATAWADRVGRVRWGDHARVTLAFGNRSRDGAGDVVPLVASPDGARLRVWLQSAGP